MTKILPSKSGRFSHSCKGNLDLWFHERSQLVILYTGHMLIMQSTFHGATWVRSVLLTQQRHIGKRACNSFLLIKPLYFSAFCVHAAVNAAPEHEFAGYSHGPQEGQYRWRQHPVLKVTFKSHLLQLWWGPRIWITPSPFVRAVAWNNQDPRAYLKRQQSIPQRCYQGNVHPCLNPPALIRQVVLSCRLRGPGGGSHSFQRKLPENQESWFSCLECSGRLNVELDSCNFQWHSF